MCFSLHHQTAIQPRYVSSQGVLSFFLFCASISHTPNQQQNKDDPRSTPKKNSEFENATYFFFLKKKKLVNMATQNDWYAYAYAINYNHTRFDAGVPLAGIHHLRSNGCA